MNVPTVLRLVCAAALFAIGVLVVVPAPTHLFWMIAIIATEWGHALALISLGALPVLWTNSWHGRLAAAFCVAAAVFALIPLLRATRVARNLPAQMERAFGNADATGIKPLGLGALFGGLRVPDIQAKTLTFKSADGSDLSMDLYAAPRSAPAAPAPIIMVIHGGSWNSGDNQDFIAMDRFLAGRGFAVADVLYRLAPQFPFPAAANDVQSALRFLRANADAFGIDRDRVILLGRSAGGQIALQAAYSANDPGIRGVISFYGPTDLFWSWENPVNPLVIDIREVLSEYLGGSPEKARDNYANASPILLAARSSPPTLLLHGGRDELVDEHHSDVLARRLTELGVPNLNIQLPWATHGFDYFTGGPGGQISAYAVESFARRMLMH